MMKMDVQTKLVPNRLLTVVLVGWVLVGAFLLDIPAASADIILENTRSRAAITRVGSDLKKSLVEGGFRWGAPMFIRIFKEKKRLEVWLAKGGAFRLFKSYPICAYSGGLGPKLRNGDLQAPEGFYFVTPGRFNPGSDYHLSFNIGYPNAYDRAHDRTGSYIMVHGQCVSIGCFAMATGPLGGGAARNRPIEEIWTLADAAFRSGQQFFRVHIFPFMLTEKNLERHAGSKWITFWRNLKQGYDHFEKSKRPPDTVVRAKRYVFAEDR